MLVSFDVSASGAGQNDPHQTVVEQSDSGGGLSMEAQIGKQCICIYKCSKRTFGVTAGSPLLLVGTASQTL